MVLIWAGQCHRIFAFFTKSLIKDFYIFLGMLPCSVGKDKGCHPGGHYCLVGEHWKFDPPRSVLYKMPMTVLYKMKGREVISETLSFASSLESQHF